MAVRAGAEFLVEGLILEVAEEAGGGGDGHVVALHDLAVAARAAEGLAAAARLQVRRMVEMDAVKIDVAGEQPSLVTAASGGNSRRESRRWAAGRRWW